MTTTLKNRNRVLTQPRAVERLIEGQPTSDGAGVKLTRVLTPLQRRPDPHLMLTRSAPTIRKTTSAASRPSARGFETVTYMIAGRMRHRDAGHEGLLERRRAMDDGRARRDPLGSPSRRTGAWKASAVAQPAGGGEDARRGIATSGAG
jgi:hypothetical protein